MQPEADRSNGFSPVARDDACILVLGSLPGNRSIQDNEYYAHPRNAFWRIMASITGANGNYGHRCNALLDHKIALWDVLASSVRPGSLDADIDLSTAMVNDFSEFLSEHRGIDRICFNGQKAAKIFRGRVAASSLRSGIELLTLPSTSPAHAAMSFAEKLNRWRSALATSNSGG